ncbi:MAG: hypothetical protein ACOCSR_02295, partial [Wenzhouxiangella sp.]
IEVGFLTAREGETGIGLAAPVPAGGWTRWFSRLVREGRAATVSTGPDRIRLWVASERLGWLQELDPALEPETWLSAGLNPKPPGGTNSARRWLQEGRRRIEGETAVATVERLFGLAPGHASGF